MLRALTCSDEQYAKACKLGVGLIEAAEAAARALAATCTPLHKDSNWLVVAVKTAFGFSDVARHAWELHPDAVVCVGVLPGGRQLTLRFRPSTAARPQSQTAENALKTLKEVFPGTTGGGHAMAASATLPEGRSLDEVSDYTRHHKDKASPFC
jgi:hypothetical protein